MTAPAGRRRNGARDRPRFPATPAMRSGPRAAPRVPPAEKRAIDVPRRPSLPGTRDAPAGWNAAVPIPAAMSATATAPYVDKIPSRLIAAQVRAGPRMTNHRAPPRSASAPSGSWPNEETVVRIEDKSPAAAREIPNRSIRRGSNAGRNAPYPSLSPWPRARGHVECRGACRRSWLKLPALRGPARARGSLGRPGGGTRLRRRWHWPPRRGRP